MRLFAPFSSILAQIIYYLLVRIAFPCCGAWKKVCHISFRLNIQVLVAEARVASFAEGSASVHDVCWLSPQIFITGDESGLITAYDVRSRKLQWQRNVPTGVCKFNRCAENGPIAVGCQQGFVHLLDAYSGNPSFLLSQRVHDDDVHALASFPSSDKRCRFVTGSYDKSAFVWRINHDSLVKEWSMLPQTSGHQSKILGSTVSSLHQHVITTGADGKVIAWFPPQ